MIRRLNHAVLFVRDAELSAQFYRRVLGFDVTARLGGDAVFLRAAKSRNDHDLALFANGGPRPAPGTVGLYHLAWQVDTVEDLARIVAALREEGALVGLGDHGVSKSAYGRDPDGIEFEVMWAAPRESWPAWPVTGPLDLDAAVTRWRGVDTSDQ